jgi:hypothetical protein
MAFAQPLLNLCLGRNQVVHKNHISDFFADALSSAQVLPSWRHQCHAVGMWQLLQ